MSELSPAALRHGRNVALDGLRGYAAAAVVFYHAILGPSPELIPDVLLRGVQAQDTPYGVSLKLVLSLLNGEIAVSIFFVISGIVLFRALAGMHKGRGARAAIALSWRFLVRRVLRIWPVMAVCLLVYTVAFQQLGAAWPGIVQVPTLHELAINLTLTAFPVHGATWTLAVELAGAPVLVLGFLGVRRWGPVALLPFFFYCALALRYNGLLFHSPGLIVGLPFLLAGAMLESVGLAPLSRFRFWRLAPLAGGALAFADILLVPSIDFKLRLVLLLIGCALLVGSVSSLRGGPPLRVLQAPLSRYLGRISFSLYLWNVPVFTVFLGLLGPEVTRAHPLETGLAVGLLAILATIPIAHLSERWLERPCIRLGRLCTGMAGERTATVARPSLAGASGQVR